MKPEILLIGPIARSGEPSKGGYESANRRTIDGLRSRGLNVEELPYDLISSSAGKLVSYIVAITKIIIRIGKNDSEKTQTIAHITALYKHFVYLEALIVLLCKLKKIKCIYDIRAGSLIRYYKNGSPLYKRFSKYLLRGADMILVEGDEYIPFIRDLVNREARYFPNYVGYEKNAMSTRSTRSREYVQLCYVGRVVKEKGINLSIEVCAYLDSMGLNPRLHVIGTGPEDYINELKEMVCIQGIGDKVIFYGPLPKERIEQILLEMHFFVFPTRHEGEGHSNSLTEAMAKGLVPVCSPGGFNKSVVSDTGIVMDANATPEEYADQIKEIISQNRWEQLSVKAETRVAENYSSEPVLTKLIGYYEQAMTG